MDFDAVQFLSPSEIADAVEADWFTESAALILSGDDNTLVVGTGGLSLLTCV